MPLGAKGLLRPGVAINVPVFRLNTIIIQIIISFSNISFDMCDKMSL